jgi:hypothetical protein
MSIREQRPFTGQKYSAEMSDPRIPMRRMPAFMKTLWLLAVLMLVGIVYSFWRISNVATPKLDLPAGAQPAGSQPN